MQASSSVRIACLGLWLIPAWAQQAGSIQPETSPSMTMEECTTDGCKPTSIDITLDMSWRWIHNQGGYTNCVKEDGMWEAEFCPDGNTCAKNCEVEGLDLEAYTGQYGVSAIDDTLRLQYIPGSRVYARQGEQYKLFKLKNREFSVQVDVSSLACGINAALYFIEMPADGGKSGAGARLGAGYCDAQCPRNTRFVDGVANTEGWAKKMVKNPNGKEVETAPEGRFGACCAEMDIFEANREAQALTAHPCSLEGPQRCDGPKECGDPKLQQPGLCDKEGCGYNSFRFGAPSFYGSGDDFDVDTSKPLTLVTQFLTADGTDDGDLTEIRRVWVQEGKIIRNSNAGLLGADAGNSITEDLCAAQVKVFNVSNDQFAGHGGLKAMGEALNRGMVLSMSIWDDGLGRMLWLDAEETTMEEKGKLGAARGPCDFDSGDAATTEKENAKAFVVFKRLKVGEINTTFKVDMPVKEPKPAMTVATTSTTDTPTTTTKMATTKRTTTKTTTKKTATVKATKTTTKKTTATKTTTTATEDATTTAIMTNSKTTVTSKATTIKVKSHEPSTIADTKSTTLAESNAADTIDTTDSCASMENCNLREPGLACQCDPGCVAYQDCCVDALKVCLKAWNKATGNISVTDSLAGSDKAHMSFAEADLPDTTAAIRQTTMTRITESSISSTTSTSFSATLTSTSAKRSTKATSSSSATTTSKATATTSTASSKPTAKKHSHHQKKHSDMTEAKETAEDTTTSGDVSQDVSTTQARVSKVLDPYCCMASTDKSNVCATCFPTAKAEAKNWCGGNESRCEDCGKVWCSLGDATPPEVYRVSQQRADEANSTGSCREYGCGEFDPSQACQCNNECNDFADCCSDAGDACDHDVEADIIMKDAVARHGSSRGVGHFQWPLVSTFAAVASLVATLLALARSLRGGAWPLLRYQQLHSQTARPLFDADAEDDTAEQARMAEA